MTRIVLLGGHGKVALRAARLLRARGDDVVGVIRSAEQSDEVAAAGATPLVADLESLDSGALAELLAGADGVVWSAGAGGGDPARTAAVDRDAAIRSIEAAERAGVSRYVMVSYFGSRPDHGVPPEHSFHAYAEAKAAADARLRESGLDWTILAPSSLTLEPGTGGIELAGEGVEAGSVSRDDVAAVLVAALGESATIRRTLAFNNGPTPIADALAAPS